ncbi:YbaK/EbsC family protein [Sphingomonas sp. ASV193]|uniref:YbaK/EbsC family protein n=1 Tax=Sphingomonas sp. ASV193 TaxID=3144405 RepID=UPI0032E9059D
MSGESVRAWLTDHAPDLRKLDGHGSTATVADAAATLGVEPGRIAKTLAIRAGETVILLVTRGDARLDNRKFKDEFGSRPRMLDAEETLARTGHPVGGVCPFGLAEPLAVYCDISLKAYATVFPAAGTRDSSVEIPVDRLAALVSTRWVDVCRSGSGD